MAIRPLHAARELQNADDGAEPGSVPQNVAVGAEIRALRKARGLTLKAVAAQAGISVGYLSEIERDIARVPIAVLRRLCDIFSVTIGWLLRPREPAPSTNVTSSSEQPTAPA